MPDKLTDNEIIKALECCTKGGTCEHCPLMRAKTTCNEYALDLINRQKKNIERLKEVNDVFTCIGKLYSEIKAEAYKECIEKVKDVVIDSVYLDELDNLLKELVGDTDV